MIEVLERYMEIAISIFIYVVSATFTVTVLVSATVPIMPIMGDKTFIESTGVQELYEADVYGYDILLMLLNTDPMSPYPKGIKINNSPVLRIDNSFIAYKMKNVAVVYSPVGDYKLSLMLKYKVTNIDYVYKGIDSPYIHFTLKEVVT